MGAALENLSAVAGFIERTMMGFGIAEHVYAVQTAVDEACSNIMLYGYPDEKGDITITCEAEDGALTVTVRDNGVSFDPDQAAPPDLEADLEHRRIGGLGIHFMKSFMDEVAYSFQGSENRLVMRKRYSA